ncbi:MAG: hypothetical protein QOI66_225, partial [Myxococcales bacterium]|nr:hypothetical protein [Myxococcales bacterium]
MKSSPDRWRVPSSLSLSLSLWVALPLATLWVAGPVHAAVVWTSTFEKGNLSEWMSGVNATKGTR